MAFKREGINITSSACFLICWTSWVPEFCFCFKSRSSCFLKPMFHERLTNWYRRARVKTVKSGEKKVCNNTHLRIGSRNLHKGKVWIKDVTNTCKMNEHKKVRLVKDFEKRKREREEVPSSVENALMTNVKVDGKRNGWSCEIANKSCP